MELLGPPHTGRDAGRSLGCGTAAGVAGAVAPGRRAERRDLAGAHTCSLHQHVPLETEATGCGLNLARYALVLDQVEDRVYPPVRCVPADDLMAQGASEFTEWDLTMASWIRDRARFGLRGYAQDHPDHKRVMMEIMGKKTSSPIMQQYMTKVRPNYYRMTSLGRAVAARIRGGGPSKIRLSTPYYLLRKDVDRYLAAYDEYRKTRSVT